MKNTLFFSDALKLSRPSAFHIMAKPAGSACNLNCKYCYYLEKSELYKDKQGRMSPDLLEKFTRQYIESQEVPVVTFTWQGGEPSLMGLDFFREAVKLQKIYAAGKRIENSFQTNGTRLDDEWCSFFAENSFLIGISIDGEEHVHNHFRRTRSGKPSFADVMKGISLLRRYKVEFNTLSTVNSYSVRYAFETYRFLKNIGSKFMQFLPVVERKAKDATVGLQLVPNNYRGEAEVTEWSVTGEAYGKFLISIFDEWVRNDVGRYFVQIFDATLANRVGQMPGLCVFSETCGDAVVLERNGDLYSCDHYVYPEYYLGNINEQPAGELVKTQKQFDFGIAKRSALPHECLRCDVVFACHGECPKHRFMRSRSGELNLNWLCEGYKVFFRHVIPYMDFMAKELEQKRPPANVMQWIRHRENQVVKDHQPGRNDPCPCGSGKKFKNCCQNNPLDKSPENIIDQLQISKSRIK
jgi:uncharacterized protein